MKTQHTCSFLCPIHPHTQKVRLFRWLVWKRTKEPQKTRAIRPESIDLAEGLHSVQGHRHRDLTSSGCNHVSLPARMGQSQSRSLHYSTKRLSKSGNSGRELRLAGVRFSRASNLGSGNGEAVPLHPSALGNPGAKHTLTEEQFINP